MSDPFLDLGRKVLDEQSFSQLIGAQLDALAPGKVTLRVPLRADLLQQNGFAHGGLISYCADNALTFAGGTSLQKPVLTSEFKINYVRPAQGDALVARAEATYTGKSQAVCRCDVFVVKDGEEKLCAVAQGTIVVAG